MTRKYTKSKKRISNKRNSKRRISKRSKRSKRINNKSKKLTKKIQKGGDDNIIDVSANSEDSIQKTIDSLAKFKSEITEDYRKYKFETSRVLFECKKKNNNTTSGKCKKFKEILETHDNNLTRRFYKSIRNVLKDMNHKKGDLDSTDIKNLQAIITLFLKKYNNTDFMYKFMYKEFDIDNLFQNQKYENENIFYNLLKSTLKDLNIKKKNDEAYIRQSSNKQKYDNKIKEFEDNFNKAMVLISKDLKNKYVEFLLNSIKKKIDNLTSLSTSSTTSTETPQSKPQQQPQQQPK
jgi:hypothetical protein